MFTWPDYANKSDLLSYLSSNSILLIDIGDQTSERRIEWFESSDLPFQLLRIESLKEFDAHLPMKAPGILVISSFSAIRASRFIANFGADFQGRPKIFLTIDSSPRARSLALRAGFDAVFDTEKDSDILAISNLIAIKRRYGFAESALVQSVGETDALNAISYIDKLSRRQAIILKALLDSPGQLVSMTTLQTELSLSDEPISENQLKVLITQTRKKLRPGALIINSSRLGKGRGAYCLITCDD